MAKAETRVYKVTETIGDRSEIRLVNAPNAAQAVRHVTKQTIKCEVVDVHDAIALVGKGVKVEQAVTEAA